MALTRNSKIKEAWKHPVGHDMLQRFAARLGRSEKWLQNPLVAGLPLKMLDRLAGGTAFVDSLLEYAAYEVDRPTIPAAEYSTWWKEAVFYQIYLPSFMDSDHDGVGDLAGVTQRLPYLSQLGVDALWLLPWESVSPDAAPCGFTDIPADYGCLEDFDALVQAAHAQNMKLVFGLNIACTGEDHPLFRAALAGDEASRACYMMLRGTREVPPNNWHRGTAPAWRWYAEAGVWALCLHGWQHPDLNWDNAALRTEITEALRFWMARGVDGFFLGPVNLVSKAGLEGAVLHGMAQLDEGERFGYGPGPHRYLRQLNTELGLADGLLAGSAPSIGTEVAKLFTASDRRELDLLLDESHLAAKSPRVRRGKALPEEAPISLPDIKNYYLKWMEQYGPERWMTLLLQTADTPRLVGRLGASPVYRGILAKLLGTLLLTLRGTPLLYQGEELGLSNTRFASLKELRDGATLRRYADLAERQGEALALQEVLADTPDHARLPMPWSTGPRGGFTGAESWIRMPDGGEYLNANAQLQDANSVLHHYRHLIALRKKHACLVYGSFNPVFTKNKKVFCYFRISEGDKWYVEMNLTEKEVPRPGRILRTMRLEHSNYDTPGKALRPFEANLYHCE